MNPPSVGLWQTILDKAATNTGDLATWAGAIAMVLQGLAAFALFWYAAKNFRLEARKNAEREEDRLQGLIHGVCAWVDVENDEDVAFVFLNNTAVPVFKVEVRLIEYINKVKSGEHIRRISLVAPNERQPGKINKLRHASRGSRELEILFTDVRNYRWMREGDGRIVRVLQR